MKIRTTDLLRAKDGRQLIHEKIKIHFIDVLVFSYIKKYTNGNLNIEKMFIDKKENSQSQTNGNFHFLSIFSTAITILGLQSVTNYFIPKFSFYFGMCFMVYRIINVY